MQKTKNLFRKFFTLILKGKKIYNAFSLFYVKKTNKTNANVSRTNNK